MLLLKTKNKLSNVKMSSLEVTLLIRTGLVCLEASKYILVLLSFIETGAHTNFFLKGTREGGK